GVWADCGHSGGHHCAPRASARHAPVDTVSHHTPHGEPRDSHVSQRGLADCVQAHRRGKDALHDAWVHRARRRRSVLPVPVSRALVLFADPQSGYRIPAHNLAWNAWPVRAGSAQGEQIGMGEEKAISEALGTPELLLKLIEREPGIRYRELLRSTGFANGVLTYHLSALEKASVIRVDRQARITRYYPVNGPETES